MIKLINKDTLKIVVLPESKITEYSKNQWYILTNEVENPEFLSGITTTNDSDWPEATAVFFSDAEKIEILRAKLLEKVKEKETQWDLLRRKNYPDAEVYFDGLVKTNMSDPDVNNVGRAQIEGYFYDCKLTKILIPKLTDMRGDVALRDEIASSNDEDRIALTIIYKTWVNAKEVLEQTENVTDYDVFLGIYNQ